jgi:hypothetical protein
MKRIFTVIGLLAVSFLLSVAGLSCSNDEISALLGKEFVLPVGKTAVISGEYLTLEFVKVEADSRCAKGVECISAGEAKCRMLIKYHGAASDIVFVQPGGNTNNLGLLGDYKVHYNLKPYPESGIQILDSEYNLVITITK